jgi:hypothetical protein
VESYLEVGHHLLYGLLLSSQIRRMALEMVSELDCMLGTQVLRMPAYQREQAAVLPALRIQLAPNRQELLVDQPENASVPDSGSGPSMQTPWIRSLPKSPAG